MEVQEVKEQLKSIFRQVINNDKWITIHPNGEDEKGKHLLLKDGETPKEAIDRVYKKEGNKEEKEFSDKVLDKVNKGSIYQNKTWREILEKRLNPDTSKSWWIEKVNKSSEDLLSDDVFSHYQLKSEEGYKTKIPSELNKYIEEKFDTTEKYITKAKQSDTKEGSKDISKEEHAKIKEQVSKMSDDELVKAHFESQKGYESETPRAGSMTKHEATYGEVAQELKRRTGRSFSTASTESEIKEALLKAKSDSKGEKKYNYTLTKREVEGDKMLGGMADTGNYYTNGEFAIDKKYLNIKGQEPTKKEEIEKSLKNILKGDSTDRYTPVKDFEIGELKREYGKPIKVAKYSYYDEKYGYERNIYLNKKYNDLFKNFDLKFGGETEPVFAYKGKDIVGVVMPINAREQSYSKTVNNEIEEELTEDKNQLKLKIDNSKEQDMAIIDELKKLITKVENTKGEEEMEIENEKVDKRKLIDEVAGIMKSAGCDDEDIRTAIGKMEKIGYDDSEASADNKKVKNEAEEEEKKVDNEDEEDEEKVEELEEEEKKDIKNKCKNSKDESYFDKLNKIYNSAKKVEEPSKSYESRQSRLEEGEKYFG